MYALGESYPSLSLDTFVCGVCDAALFIKKYISVQLFPFCPVFYHRNRVLFFPERFISLSWPAVSAVAECYGHGAIRHSIVCERRMSTPAEPPAQEQEFRNINYVIMWYALACLFRKYYANDHCLMKLVFGSRMGWVGMAMGMSLNSFQ